jgi:hypothetical protein
MHIRLIALTALITTAVASAASDDATPASLPPTALIKLTPDTFPATCATHMMSWPAKTLAIFLHEGACAVAVQTNSVYRGSKGKFTLLTVPQRIASSVPIALHQQYCFGVENACKLALTSTITRLNDKLITQASDAGLDLFLPGCQERITTLAIALAYKGVVYHICAQQSSSSGSLMPLISADDVQVSTTPVTLQFDAHGSFTIMTS